MSERDDALQEWINPKYAELLAQYEAVRQAAVQGEAACDNCGGCRVHMIMDGKVMFTAPCHECN